MKESAIFLIRHGLTEGNIKDWYYGSTDVPLIDEAYAQLDEYVSDGIYPSGNDISFYTSGMTRAVQTLKHIWGDVDFCVIKEFREFDFGDYECTPSDIIVKDEVYRNWLKPENSDMPLPGGSDSRNSFGCRVNKGFRDLLNAHAAKELQLRHREQAARTLAVCHGGVIGKIMQIIFPDEFDHTFKRMPVPGRGFHLRVSEGNVIGYDYI